MGRAIGTQRAPGLDSQALSAHLPTTLNESCEVRILIIDGSDQILRRRVERADERVCLSQPAPSGEHVDDLAARLKASGADISSRVALRGGFKTGPGCYVG